jgi:hypothetical protein
MKSMMTIRVYSKDPETGEEKELVPLYGVDSKGRTLRSRRGRALSLILDSTRDPDEPDGTEPSP